jgi:hypothetical protein
VTVAVSEDEVEAEVGLGRYVSVALGLVDLAIQGHLWLEISIRY